jgi:hypothetical protein
VDPRLRDSPAARPSPGIFRLSIASLLLLALATSGVRADTPGLDPVTTRLGVSRVRIQSLRVDSPALRIPVDLDGRRVTLSLAPSALRAPGFRLRVAANGALHDVPAPAPASVRGTVVEMPGSVVGGTIRNGQLRAAIALADRRVFHVEPLSEVESGADPTRHAIYAAEDAIGSEGTCAATGLGELVAPGLDDDRGEAVAAIRTAEIAFDADFEFYSLNGSSVNGTVADIENVLAQVNAVYERDVELTHVITTILVRSGPGDPYTTTDAGDLIDEFINHWVAAQSSVVRDVAHLMTGKNLDGGTVGIASVGGICSRSRGYGLSRSRFSSNMSRRCALTAHELGHNWNARHCDDVTPCNIMCSSLGGCDGIGQPNFEPLAITAIRSYAASRTCLQTPQVGTEPSANRRVQFARPAPTPFTGETELSFELSQAGSAELEIFDVAGHRVAQLLAGSRGPGWHHVSWSGLDQAGRPVDAGVYYARLHAAGMTLSQKLVLLR